MSFLIEIRGLCLGGGVDPKKMFEPCGSQKKI